MLREQQRMMVSMISSQAHRDACLPSARMIADQLANQNDSQNTILTADIMLGNSVQTNHQKLSDDIMMQRDETSDEMLQQQLEQQMLQEQQEMMRQLHEQHQQQEYLAQQETHMAHAARQEGGGAGETPGKRAQRPQ